MSSNPPTPEQKEAIIKLLQQGWSTEQIARRLGVRPGTVSAIKAHRTMGTYNARTTASKPDQAPFDDDDGIKFGLERDLQITLRAHIDQLESGLKIIDSGKEMNTEIGRVDITAEDAQGVVVVIELKADVADQTSITQIQAYMGALRRKFGKSVRGILIARDFPLQVQLAAQVSNIKLVKYGFKFTFTQLDE